MKRLKNLFLFCVLLFISSMINEVRANTPNETIEQIIVQENPEIVFTAICNIGTVEGVFVIIEYGAVPTGEQITGINEPLFISNIQCRSGVHFGKLIELNNEDLRKSYQSPNKQGKRTWYPNTGYICTS